VILYLMANSGGSRSPVSHVARGCVPEKSYAPPTDLVDHDTPGQSAEMFGKVLTPEYADASAWRSQLRPIIQGAGSEGYGRATNPQKVRKWRGRAR
jgi:hypothetical protein